MGKQKAAPPMRFEPSDFSTDKYRCVNVINLRDRCPVIIMASESCDPPYYRVVDGSLEMFCFICPILKQWIIADRVVI